MSDDESDYEPEYEIEQVTVEEGIQVEYWAVVPPPIEFMANLHRDRLEISGRQLWTGSLCLAGVLIQKQKETRLFDGQRYTLERTFMTPRFALGAHFFYRILELGSGTGVLGIALSMIAHPACLALTDGDDKALELLQQNLDNKNNDVDDRIVGARRLLWGPDFSDDFVQWCREKWKTCWKAESEAVEFDVIVAGDVLYKSELPNLCFATVSHFLTLTGTLWLCHVPRANVTQELVQQAARQAGFAVETIASDGVAMSNCPVDDRCRAQVYRMTKQAIHR